MPEGDTVWLAARRLQAALADRVLTRTDFRVPRLATTNLTGRRVQEVVSRGKHILTRIDDGLTLHTHLGMEGSWHIYPHGQPWRGPAWQARVVLGTADHVCVGFRLPVVDLVQSAAESDVVGHLGPDLLGPDWDQVAAVRRLAADPAREIGAALLDQRLLAGLGNLWRCEVLFLRGVSPFTVVGDVADLPRLVDLAQRVLTANRHRADQTATGSARRSETRWVYRREGLPCRRCSTAIIRAIQEMPPYARQTYWCPRCQPGPVPAGASRARRGSPRAPGTPAGERGQVPGVC